MARGKIATVEGFIPQLQNKKIGSLSDLDEIILYMQGKSHRRELTRRLEDYFDRLQQTADWLRKFGAIYKVRKMVKTHFGVSDRTALQYCEDAQLAFGTVALHNQNFHVDAALAELNKDMELARAKEDFRALGRLHQLKKDYIKDFFGGSEAEFYRRLAENPPTILLGFYPEQVQQNDVPTDPKALERKLQKYKQKVREKAYQSEAIDVEIDEMPEDDGIE